MTLQQQAYGLIDRRHKPLEEPTAKMKACWRMQGLNQQVKNNSDLLMGA